jgi:hypothetical protein
MGIMTNPYQKVLPNNGRIFFDGGKSNKYDQSLIPNNESPDCANVIFSNGSVETRPGTIKASSGIVGSFPGKGLFSRKENGGSETMIAAWDGTLYDYDGINFSTISGTTGAFNSFYKLFGAQAENYLFLGNGGQPYKYNEYFTRHGIETPSVINSWTCGAAGVLTGKYGYKVSYVNSALVEGNASTLSTEITLASGKGYLYGIPTAPASYGVNARRIYRTKSGSTACRVAEITDNTTTTYIDNIPDASVTISAPNDNNVPPNYTVILFHQGRMFVNDLTEPNIIKYSDLNNPYIFPSLNFIRVGDNTTDLVRCLAVYENSILIFCDHSQWIIYMESTTPTDWRLVKVKSNYGCKSPFAPVYFNNKILFPATQNDKFVGFAAIVGSSIDPSATQLTVNTMGSELKSDRIEPDMFNIPEAYIEGISAIIYQNKAYISVPYGTGATYNNRIYVYDFSISNLNKQQEAAWCPWTGLNSALFTIYNGDLCYINADSSGSFVYKMNQDVYNDDGNAIDSYYWTKEFAGLAGSEENWKDFRFIDLFYELSADYNMDLTYRVNSASDVGTTKQIDLNPGGSIWDTAIWDLDLWDTSQLNKESLEFLDQCSGKRLQVRFSNQNAVDQKFKAIGMKIFYNLKGKR